MFILPNDGVTETKVLNKVGLLYRIACVYKLRKKTEASFQFKSSEMNAKQSYIKIKKLY